MADYAGGELRAGSDALGARWIAEPDLRGLELRAEVRRVIQKGYVRRQWKQ